MTTHVGALGTNLSRRQFTKAAGTAGVFGLAGCAAPTNTDPSKAATAAQRSAASLPQAAKPEVVDVTEQGNLVTLRAVTSSLPVHPGSSMGGPVELPRVWAWQADDRAPSVPGPIIRTTEGEDIEVPSTTRTPTCPTPSTSTASARRGRTTASRRRRASR